jgi:uncharacterized protein (DUF2249 family)
MTFRARVTTTLDVRKIPGCERHPLILGRFDDLAPGEALLLVDDHDPNPQMTGDLRGLLTARGFQISRRASPGQLAFENYW